MKFTVHSPISEIPANVLMKIVLAKFGIPYTTVVFNDVCVPLRRSVIPQYLIAIFFSHW